MGAHASHLPRPADRPVTADVLVAGAERTGRHPSLWAAAVVAALVVAAAAVDRAPAPPDPVLVLREGEIVPRDRTLDERLAEAGLHVEVVNAGDRTLDLRRAALVPGAWEVDVVDRPLLVPGESLVLSLHRTVLCDEHASYGPSPEHLVLEARTADDGRPVVVRLPVADDAAYGGRLDDALRDPGRACVVSGDDVGGPLGDLVGSWRARRAWPPPG